MSCNGPHFQVKPGPSLSWYRGKTAHATQEMSSQDGDMYRSKDWSARIWQESHTRVQSINFVPRNNAWQCDFLQGGVRCHLRIVTSNHAWTSVEDRTLG